MRRGRSAWRFGGLCRSAPFMGFVFLRLYGGQLTIWVYHTKLAAQGSPGRDDGARADDVIFFTGESSTLPFAKSASCT